MAHEIGYGNLSFFYKKFHEYFGIKLNEYIENDHRMGSQMVGN
ncbi:hypothetical protein [Metabacillus bambusae]